MLWNNISSSYGTQSCSLHGQMTSYIYKGTIHLRCWQNFHDFWTLPPYRRQFFITIRWQIWLIFDPFPPRKCRRLKWMVLKFKLQAQDSNSEYFYFGDLKNESHFMKKATFSPIRELIILLEITRMTCKESKKPVYICRNADMSNRS